MAKRNKKNQVDLSEYNERGIRMLKVLCWSQEWNWRTENVAFDLQELLNENIDPDHNCLIGEPEEWDNAEGYIYSHWGSGGSYSPYGKNYDFSELVSEQAGCSHDEGFDFNVYDADGRQRELVTRIEASLGNYSAYSNDEGFDDWIGGAAARKIKADAKKARAATRKAKKVADKKAVLDSLTPKQRKVLGL